MTTTYSRDGLKKIPWWRFKQRREYKQNLKIQEKYIGDIYKQLERDQYYYEIVADMYKMYGQEGAERVATTLGLDPKSFDWDRVADYVGVEPDYTGYDFAKYLDGLFASQGAENETNRQFNSAQAVANRQFQAQESQLQRDWYESMSNSAYQRATADMQAAGINPILAYQNGGAAVAGTGIAAGSAASYGSTGGDSISSILSSVADVINAVSGSSAKKVDSALKIFKTFS